MESFIAAEACCWYIPVLRLVQELQLLPSYVSHLILSTARTREQQRWSSFTLSPFTAGQRSEGHSPSPLPLVQKSKTSLAPAAELSLANRTEFRISHSLTITPQHLVSPLPQPLFEFAPDSLPFLLFRRQQEFCKSGIGRAYLGVRAVALEFPGIWRLLYADRLTTYRETHPARIQSLVLGIVSTVLLWILSYL